MARYGPIAGRDNSLGQVVFIFCTETLVFFLNSAAHKPVNPSHPFEATDDKDGIARDASYSHRQRKPTERRLPECDRPVYLCKTEIGDVRDHAKLIQLRSVAVSHGKPRRQ